jgi:hypothetical protein
MHSITGSRACSLHRPPIPKISYQPILQTYSVVVRLSLAHARYHQFSCMFPPPPFFFSFSLTIAASTPTCQLLHTTVISLFYHSFLLECHGYWIKFAAHKARLCTNADVWWRFMNKLSKQYLIQLICVSVTVALVYVPTKTLLTSEGKGNICIICVLESFFFFCT